MKVDHLARRAYFRAVFSGKKRAWAFFFDGQKYSKMNINKQLLRLIGFAFS